MATPQAVPDKNELIKLVANKIAKEQNADVFFYNSEIARPFDQELISLVRKRKRRQDVLLLLCTEGGDPDAAYRIARCLQSHYRKFTCIVAGYCKSAGTLITLGAHEVVIDDAGELGPLDIQMSKRDELGESQSGLIVTTALEALAEKSFSGFEHFFMTMKRKGRRSISLRMATEIACKMTTGLFSHIYSQIDPMHMGETYRATAIAQQYGLRLDVYGGNLRRESLDYLIARYPSHSFVIDREEAESIFKNVRCPDGAEATLITLLDDDAQSPLSGEAFRREFLSDELMEEQDVTAQSQGDSNEGAAGREATQDAGGNAPGSDLWKSASAASQS